MLRYDARLHWRRPLRPDESPGGRDLKGRDALYRIYDTSEGALAIACTTAAHATALARMRSTSRSSRG